MQNLECAQIMQFAMSKDMLKLTRNGGQYFLGYTKEWEMGFLKSVLWQLGIAESESLKHNQKMSYIA